MKYRILIDGKVIREQIENLSHSDLREYLSQYRLGDTNFDGNSYDYILYTPKSEANS